MGAITQVAVGATSDELDRKRFRGTAKTKLAPEVIARQSKVALLAFQSLPDRETALSFLNSEDETLGGRPIDVASGSEAGVERVTAMLRARMAPAAKID